MAVLPCLAGVRIRTLLQQPFYNIRSFARSSTHQRRAAKLIGMVHADARVDELLCCTQATIVAGSMQRHNRGVLLGMYLNPDIKQVAENCFVTFDGGLEEQL